MIKRGNTSCVLDRLLASKEKSVPCIVTRNKLKEQGLEHMSGSASKEQSVTYGKQSREHGSSVESSSNNTGFGEINKVVCEIK
jgi:hypothetical protein